MKLRGLVRGFLRFGFAFLLLATGLGKLWDIPGFVEVVNDYDVLPQVLALPAALSMIISEIALSAWLLSGRRPKMAALITGALHLVFMAWVGLALYRGLDIENCGCFGVFLARPRTHWTFFQDFIMSGLSFVLYFLEVKRR